MNSELTINCQLHFQRRGHGARKELASGPAPTLAPPRTPRVARLMALALRYEQMVRSGEVIRFAAIARAGHVTRARMSQIMCLVNLAPDIIEAILFSPAVESGRDPVVLRDVLPVSAVVDWAKQRRIWRDLLRDKRKSSGNC